MTWDDETRARAAGMKRAGMTNKQIADRLGTTAAAVSKACGMIGAYRRLNHAGGGNFNGEAPTRLIRYVGHGTIEDLTGEP